MAKLTAAIVGPGNIGTDLLMKLKRSDHIEVVAMVGVDPSSAGLSRAADQGIEVTAQGVPWLLENHALPDLIFEATSATVHSANAAAYAQADVIAVDLTPAAIGPYVCPPVNLEENRRGPNLNMITCGGQATIPIVHAVSRATPVAYAEIVASIASRSAGPGTRANIDEFTTTTAQAIEQVGGAARGKAIVVLNPADPPMIMRNTVYCALDPDADQDAVTASIHDMVVTVQDYVPGYELKADPIFETPRESWGGYGRVTILLEVRGAGDFLPPWAGNLDIITAAATRVGELLAQTPAAVA